MEDSSNKLPGSQIEWEFLKELAKNKVPFMIVGLSAATLQGAFVVTQDIDLWFKDVGDPLISKIIQKFGGAYVSTIPTIMNAPRFVGSEFHALDIVFNIGGVDSFDEEFQKAKTVEIDGVPFFLLPLEKIIQSKKSANRPKDKAVMPVLEDTLKTLSALNKIEKK